jgi:hypothetical protein
MAISGHKSMAEVQKYIKNADQKLMAERAIARTVNYPQSLCVGNLEKKA